jgi:ElaB/YqjD/DUF883 family membrane-anchored ribosome-binding protein
MFSINKIATPAGNALDHSGQVAEQAIQATQQLAQDALDGLSGGAQQLRSEATPLLQKAADRASSMAHCTVDAIRDQSLRLRDQAERATTNTTHYIRAEPVKSVLVAAAAGAALMALVSLLSRSRA